MFERFNEESRRAVAIAQAFAKSLNHHHLGTEHMLMALIDQENFVSAKIVDSFNISRDALYKSLNKALPAGEIPSPETTPLTPRAKKVLELTLREALQLGHDHVGTEHLLLGIIREGDSLSAQELSKAGVTINRARTQIVQLVQTDFDKATSEENAVLDGVVFVNGLSITSHKLVSRGKEIGGDEFQIDVQVTMSPDMVPQAGNSASLLTSSKLVDRIVERVTSTPISLPEHLANEVFDIIWSHAGPSEATVTVHKLHSHNGHAVGNVSVSLTKQRPQG